MSAYLVRPRSSIADPELARAATVDLPTGRSIRDLQPPQALLDAVAEDTPPSAEQLRNMGGGAAYARGQYNQRFLNGAANALSRMGPKVIPTLIVTLRDGDVLIRSVSAQALSIMGADAYPALAAVTQALKDPDYTVRSHAMVGLTAMARTKPDAIPVLIDALSHKDGSVRLATGDPPPLAGDDFLWPVNGKVIGAFGKIDQWRRRDGIDIAARRGAPVLAAQDGIVAYAGEGIRGYGKMILLRHDQGYITTYAHNAAILVEVGDRVTGLWPTQSPPTEIGPDVSTTYRYALGMYQADAEVCHLGVRRGEEEMQFDIAPRRIPGGRRAAWKPVAERTGRFFR